MTRLIHCQTCHRMHPVLVSCAVCQARLRVNDRFCLAVGKAAYARLRYLIDAERDTPEGAELDVLASLISNVEGGLVER